MNRFTHATDQELLQAIQQANQEAFEVLYYRYYAWLCKIAYKRIPSHELVEELVQDVWVNVWQKANQLDSLGNIQAYLYATLRNKILYILRSERNRKYFQNKIRELSTGMNQPSVDESLSEKAMVAFLQEAIASLSPQCREAFLLSREEQLSYREIAQRMQISVSTVEKHIAKALQVIRFIFAQWNRILLVGGILVATVVRYILFDTCWD